MDNDFLDDLDDMDFSDDGAHSPSASPPPAQSGFDGGNEIGKDATGDTVDTIDWESPPSGGYAVDPEPVVDHFVNGKRIRSGRWARRVLLILLIGGVGAGLFILFNPFARSGIFPASTEAAFRKEINAKRTVVIQTRGLRGFAPNLYRQHLSSGMDLELHDNGKRVADNRYSLEFQESPLAFLVILDIKKRDPATLKRAQALLSRLQEMTVRVDGKLLPKSWRLYIRTGTRLTPAGRSIHPATAIRSLISLPGPGGNHPFLVPLLSGFTNDALPRQVVYVTDRESTGRDAPEAVRLYSFLKQHASFQIYRFLLGTPSRPQQDMFAYLSANARDFSPLSESFGDFSFESDPERVVAVFGRQVARVLPLALIRLVYNPEKPDKPGSPRQLAIKLRLRRNDTELSTLTTSRYTPVTYRYQIPAIPVAHRPEFIQRAGMVVGRQEFLLQAKRGTRRIQYWMGRAINSVSGSLIAVSDAGLFLVRGERDALPKLDTEEEKRVQFFCPNPYFKRSWFAVSDKGPLSSAPYPFREAPATRTEVTFPVFCFYPGDSPLSGKQFGSQHQVVFGRNQNKTANQSASLLGLLSAQGWNIRYGSLIRAVSASHPDKNGLLSRVSGFELLSAFQWLAARFTTRPIAAVFDTPAVSPYMWNGVSDRAAAYIARLQKKVAQGGGWMIAPLAPDQTQNTSPALLQADALVHDGQKFRTRDPSRYAGKKGLAIFPLPGKWRRDSETGLTAAGGALAAARLLPALSLAAVRLPGQPRHEVVAALQDAVARRHRIGLPADVRNRGIITAPLLRGYLHQRRTFLSRQLVLTNLRKDAYSHIDSLLTGSWSSNRASLTRLAVVPDGDTGNFFKTYQYFDRAPLITGRPSGDAFYDAFTPFFLNKEERQELALLYHRGLLFLLCTRNRHRGWIVNIDSHLADSSAPVIFDPAGKMALLMTARGELLFLDLFRGTLLRVRLHSGSGGRDAGHGLRTDYVRGRVRLLADTARRQLWLFGCQNRYPLRLKWKRRGASGLDVYFDPTIPCHKRELFRQIGSKKRRPLGFRFLAEPVLFPSGTVNLILQAQKGAEEKPVYIKIDRHGRYF